MTVDTALEEQDVLLGVKDYKSGVKPVCKPDSATTCHLELIFE